MAAVFTLSLFERLAHARADAEAARRAAAENQLKLLESQLEPHMLFNTLANLRALIGSDPRRAQQMLDHMIGYLRATLNGSRTTTHTLAGRVRAPARLPGADVRPHGPAPGLSRCDCRPSWRSIRCRRCCCSRWWKTASSTAWSPRWKAAASTVNARREGGQLVLEVVDTGVGPATPPGAGTGFGLTQVRERLATLHGDAAGLEFTGEPDGGSRTTIRLPLQT